MTTQTKYNGWTNYETWLVKVWLDNDEGSQNYWQDRTREAYEATLPDKTFSQIENAALTLMDELKDQHEEIAFEQVKQDNGFVHDLLNAALGEVNWHEIAVSLIEDNIKGFTDTRGDFARLKSVRPCRSVASWALRKGYRDAKNMTQTKNQHEKASASQNRAKGMWALNPAERKNTEAPIKTWAKAIVAASSYPDAMVEGLAAEHAKVLAQRDQAKANAEALAEALREALIRMDHLLDDASGEHSPTYKIARAALAQWEEGQ